MSSEGRPTWSRCRMPPVKDMTLTLGIIQKQNRDRLSNSWLFISANCSTCFVWYLHPSSGAHITVSTVSGIIETVIATYRERDVVKLTIGSNNGLNNARYCRYSDMSS